MAEMSRMIVTTINSSIREKPRSLFFMAGNLLRRLRAEMFRRSEQGPLVQQDPRMISPSNPGIAKQVRPCETSETWNQNGILGGWAGCGKVTKVPAFLIKDQSTKDRSSPVFTTGFKGLTRFPAYGLRRPNSVYLRSSAAKRFASGHGAPSLS